MDRLTRRGFLAGLVSGLALWPASAWVQDLAQSIIATDKNLEPLRVVAERAGIYYGTATSADGLRDMPDLAAAIAKECNIVVPEYDLKWEALRPTAESWNFDPVDRLLAFAEKNDMKVRGHTLVWHESFPRWARRQLHEDDGLGMLEEHIHTVVERYRGKLIVWDVVNEAIDNKSGHDRQMRKTPWLRALGPSYIDSAFTFAAEADPGAKLVYNDYGQEYPGGEKAKAILALLHHLQDSKVPIHGVGMQAHLKVGSDIDRDNLGAFCCEVKRMGLDLLITELDVKDENAPEDVGQADQRVADKTHEFLDVVCSVVKPTQILTWGLSDRATWLAMPDENPSGDPVRPLPLDVDCQRKLMWLTLYDEIKQMAKA